MIRVADWMPSHEPQSVRFLREQALSPHVLSMEGSRILAAASDARALKSTGVDVCDLTVGDYSPEQFRAPDSFIQDLVKEVTEGRNQYPPSDGLPELQASILDFYERELQVRFPEKSVVICGGARPPIYAIFRSLISEGTKVAYSVPSWNNDYYTLLCGGEPVIIESSAENDFMPTAKEVESAISDFSVRMLCLNSPLNPCGTVMKEETLRDICEVVISENLRRLGQGVGPVFLMFDMVYWPLCFGEQKFHHPIEVAPEISPWVIYVDAISKWMVGTGLRLGWAVVPPYLYEPVRDLMGHIGGWAPRAVQAASAKFLLDAQGFETFQGSLRGRLKDRLDLASNFFAGMKTDGLQVDALLPQGAIYASVRFDVIGKKTKSGEVLKTNTDIRKYLLHEAHVALVPFQAFGLWAETGWFRISVGAVSTASLGVGLVRIRRAILDLSD